MGIPLNILLIEDSEHDALLIQRTLFGSGLRPAVTRVSSETELRASLERPGWDVILSDSRLRDLGAEAALRLRDAAGIDLPLVVVSGAVSEETAASLVRQGAEDFVSKTNLGRLPGVIERVLREAGGRREKAEAAASVLYDRLTGLPSRPLLLEEVGRALEAGGSAEAPEGGPAAPFALVWLNLDRFRVILDSLGHRTGDRLLASVSGRLTACLKPGEMAARVGTDEFGLLLRGVRDEASARREARRIRERFRFPFLLDGHEVSVTVCLGIRVCAGGPARAEDLARDAGTALHRAKAQGADRTVIFDHAMHACAVAALRTQSDLRRAIREEHLHALYQPILSLADPDLTAAEALLRWDHPVRGLVPPAEFIPVAEDTGLILPLGRWILDAACRQNGSWQESGLAPLRVSVNLSARQLRRREVIPLVEDALARTGLDPRWLELELTESVILEDPAEAAETLRELRRIGVYLSIDDFGTGYSSLSYLRRLPVHAVKIDRSFVRDLGADRNSAPIVSAVIALAHDLGLGVVAEGVEKPQQLSLLRSMGCDAAQGNLISPPLRPEQLAEMAREWDRGAVPREWSRAKIA